MKNRLLSIMFVVAAATAGSAQHSTPEIEGETIQHFQALLRIDTSSPPGNETGAVDYLKQVFDTEGIPYQTFARDPSRATFVARLEAQTKKHYGTIVLPTMGSSSLRVRSKSVRTSF
jgi:hypothetical protein